MLTRTFRGRVESTSSKMAVYASFDENIVNIVPVDEVLDEFYNPDGTLTVKLRGAQAIGTFQIEEGGGKSSYDWSKPPSIPEDAVAEGEAPKAAKAVKGAGGAADGEARAKRAEKLKQLLKEGRAPWLKAS